MNGDTHSLKEREDPGVDRDKLTFNCTEQKQNSAFSSACQGIYLSKSWFDAMDVIAD